LRLVLVVARVTPLPVPAERPWASAARTQQDEDMNQVR
jgi:hypothetical protein